MCQEGTRKGTGGIHEVEVHKIVDLELLELQHHRAKIRAEDFGVCVVLHFGAEGLLRVQAEALAGARAS